MSSLFKCCTGKGQEQDEFSKEADWQNQVRHVVNSSSNLATGLEEHLENSYAHMSWFYIVCKPEKDTKKNIAHAGSPEACAFKKNGLHAIVTRYTPSDNSNVDIEILVRSVLESECSSAEKVLAAIKDLLRSMNVNPRLVLVVKKNCELRLGTNLEPDKRVDLVGNDFRAFVIGA